MYNPKRLLMTILGIIGATQMILAQTDDRNIVIENKTQEFSFDRARGNNPVQILEKYKVLYRCNSVRKDILFSEMYDDNEEIRDINIRVDDKKAKGITPKFEYYSVQNIFYSDARVCYFVLPLDKKGGHSQVTLEKVYKDPRYFTTVYFSEDQFLEKKTIRFSIPRWMKVEIREYNFEGHQIVKSSSYDSRSDADIITYEASNLSPIKPEPASPGGSYIYPHLLVMCKEAQVNGNKVEFFNTLADQYKWYHQLVMNIGDDKAALTAKAKELTAGITNDLAKVKTIYQWVQRNIRYIAYEDGIAGFKPARANEVLAKKYGDCKGMANLTRGLLRALGFDARLCWIGTNHIAYDYSTPSMAVDNHMICALFYKGKRYFLDATESNIGLNEYAERIQGRQVLIENGDTYILDRIPRVTPEQNAQVEKINLQFDGKENLKGNVQISYRGESRSSLLDQIERTRKDNLNQSLVSYLSEDDRNYEINDLNTGDLTAMDSVLTIRYQVEHKKAASAFGDEIYMEADFRKELDGFIIDTAKRKLDVMLPYHMDLLTESEIKVPQGYKVKQLPQNKEWNHPNIQISISYTGKGNTIEYRKQIRIPGILLRKKSFAAWDRIMKELSNQYHEQIILEKQ